MLEAERESELFYSQRFCEQKRWKTMMDEEDIQSV